MLDEGRWPLRFGAWTPEELRATLRDSSGAGADQGLDDTSRFVRGVARLVRRRQAVDQDRTDPPAISIFLLSPNPPRDVEFKRDPLLHAGHTCLAGKIWCVNAPVKMGWGVDFDTADADELFVTVTDKLELGGCPAIIVDSRLDVTEVQHYPKGLEEPDTCVQVRLHTSDVDILRLSDVVERVYQSHLKTPDAQPRANKLWEEPRNHEPHQLAEYRIQALLLPAFSIGLANLQSVGRVCGNHGSCGHSHRRT